MPFRHSAIHTEFQTLYLLGFVLTYTRNSFKNLSKMSSSSSSSSSPDPRPTPKNKPTDKKGKKKATSTSQATTSGRNEGVDPNWAYKPPPGVVLLDTSSSQAQSAGDFDWDAVANNPDLELWLIRVPDAVCNHITTNYASVLNTKCDR